MTPMSEKGSKYQSLVNKWKALDRACEGIFERLEVGDLIRDERMLVIEGAAIALSKALLLDEDEVKEYIHSSVNW